MDAGVWKEQLSMRLAVSIIILIAAATTLLDFGRFANLIAILSMVVFGGGWGLAWRTGQETKKVFGTLAGLGLSLTALYMYADTPPAAIASEPVDFVPTEAGQIVFSSGGGSYMVNADGTHQTRLTEYANDDFILLKDLNWSPDGEQIAYMGHAFLIYVMNADGSDHTAISALPILGDQQPVWGHVW